MLVATLPNVVKAVLVGVFVGTLAGMPAALARAWWPGFPPPQPGKRFDSPRPLC